MLALAVVDALNPWGLFLSSWLLIYGVGAGNWCFSTFLVFLVRVKVIVSWNCKRRFSEKNLRKSPGGSFKTKLLKGIKAIHCQLNRLWLEGSLRYSTQVPYVFHNVQSLLFAGQTSISRIILSVQIFLSHTKLDKDFCDRFDNVAARVGLKFFRSELENIQAPAWATIKKEIETSAALFLLVGKELVSAQALSDSARRERMEVHSELDFIRNRNGMSATDGRMGHMRRR